MPLTEEQKEKRRTYDKAYREANPEKDRVRKKAYREASPEKIKAYRKANLIKDRIWHKVWHELHPEKASIYNKTCRAANLEKYSARYKAWARANPDKIRERDDKRRALKHKIPFESINHKRVFIRDGWICQICHKKVDKNLKYPDPMSPSLDHITPLSKDGTHIYSNVQLAHFGCNSGKKDNVLPQGEQMRLF